MSTNETPTRSLGSSGSTETRSDLVQLEARVLMSASPLAEALDQSGGDELAPGDEHPLIAPLSASGSGGPATFEADVIVVGEDHNDSFIDLGEFFVDDETSDDQLVYEIVDNSNSSLFDSLTVSGKLLVVGYAPNAVGESVVTVSATDGDGNSANLDIPIAVLPINDRPTTSGFSDIEVSAGTATTVIDLFASFDDIEDADQDLTFELTQNSNPILFESIDINHDTGLLTLTYAADAFGTSQLTIRATDTDGGFVEMSTAGANFEIYENFQSGSAGTHWPSGIDFAPSRLLTGWAFGQHLEGVSSSEIDVAHYRWYLNEIINGPSDQLIVLDLEAPAFADNTPEARENLALAMDILREERPDLTRVGFYMLLPERNYWAPAQLAAIENTIDRGINVAWANTVLPDRQLALDEWVGRNALYRTELLADGSTVAEKVDVVTPSLYTFYSNSFSETQQAPVYAQAVPNAVDNSWQLVDNVVANGMSVQLIAEDAGSLPIGVDVETHYFVVNSTLGSFQLATSVGGQPIDIGDSSGRQYVKLTSEYSGHDPYHKGWMDYYAKSNIEEARKFGKETIAYLSPRYESLGNEYLDKNQFRDQLDTMLEQTDGVVLFNNGEAATDQGNHGWWEALAEFQDYINSPTQFSITVNGVDGADVFSIAEDQTLDISGEVLLANDTIQLLFGDSVDMVIGPEHAQSFSLSSDGSFSYVPHSDFNGLDGFSYLVSGPSGVTSAIPVLIHVTPVNDAPLVVSSPHGVVSVGQTTARDIWLGDVFGDVDDDANELYYELLGNSVKALNLGVSVDDGYLQIDPRDANLGTTELTVMAMDSSGQTALWFFEVEVARVFAPLMALDLASEQTQDIDLPELVSLDLIQAFRRRDLHSWLSIPQLRVENGQDDDEILSDEIAVTNHLANIGLTFTSPLP